MVRHQESPIGSRGETPGITERRSFTSFQMVHTHTRSYGAGQSIKEEKKEKVPSLFSVQSQCITVTVTISMSCVTRSVDCIHSSSQLRLVTAEVFG